MTERDDPAGVSVPGWFVKLVTGAIILAAPFFIWVTVTLLTLQFQVSALATIPDRYNAQREQIIRLESRESTLESLVTTMKEKLASIETEQSRRTKNVYAIEALTKSIEEIKKDVSTIKNSLK